MRRSGQTVSIGFSLVDRAGESYAPGVQKGGKTVPAPKLKIVDEGGKVLASSAFQYG